jgi:lysophospholipase L1-like esterase
VDSSRASTPFRTLALAVTSTILFGAAIEGLARWIEPPPVQKEEYLWDWSERFKDAEFYTLEKGEGYPPDEETNVDGLRDFTRPVERVTPWYPRRLVILGDSVTFGHGLNASQAFPRLLESRPRVDEVFNVALPGWSTRQERLAYERIARKYKPNAVILAVCLNDLAELQINLTRPPPLLLSLFKHSAAVRLALGASRREIGAVEELFTEPNSPRVHDAFRLFFQEVRALRDEVVKDGATFRIVVFPFRFQLEPNAPAPSVQERIAIFGATEEIPVIDLLKEFKAEKNPAALFLDYDHLSERGHTVVAGLLSREFPIEFPPPFEMPPRLQTAREALAELHPPNSEVDELTLWRIREAAPRFEKGTTAKLKEALVEAAVSKPSPRVRFEAARTLFCLGLPGAASVPALIRGVRHEDPRVRAFATWTLGEMGEIARPAIPALVALARLDGGAGKTGALTAIGKIGGDSPEAIPLLLQELKHPKEARRYRAARTLGKMGPAGAPAIPGLLEALHDPSALVRLHAVRALGEIGEASKPAVPALIEVLNHDQDPEVRKEVSLTLSRLPGR